MSAEEVQSVLFGKTARYSPVKNSFFTGKSKIGAQDFSGKIEEMQFEITPVITYRNSFNPTAKGEIKCRNHGSLIEVECRMNSWVYIFISIWMVFLLLILLFSILSYTPEFTDPESLIIPLVILLFGYGLTIGAFKYESIPLRNKLKDILNAEINQGL